MDEVVAFYQTILKLPCAIPQAESIKVETEKFMSEKPNLTLLHFVLQKFIETVKEFRAKATQLLSDVSNQQVSAQMLSELEELFDAGVSLDLQLPELPQLKEVCFIL